MATINQVWGKQMEIVFDTFNHNLTNPIQHGQRAQKHIVKRCTNYLLANPADLYLHLNKILVCN